MIGYQRKGGGKLVKDKGGQALVTEDDLTLGGGYTMQYYNIQIIYHRNIHVKHI